METSTEGLFELNNITATIETATATPWDSNTTQLYENVTNVIVDMAKDLTFQQRFRLITYTYILPVMSGFGIVFNLINLVVLNQKQMSGSFYTYLAVIASTDMGVCLWQFIFSTITRHQNTHAARVYDAFILAPFTNFCIDASIWITCMMAVERLISVARPLAAKSILSKARTHIGICAVLIYDALANVPRFFIYRPAYDESESRHYTKPTDFARTNIYNVINWYYTVTINFIPLTVQIVCNIAIIAFVRAAGTRRNRMSMTAGASDKARRNEEHKMTITLIGILCFSIICTLPSAFSDIQVAYFIFAEDGVSIGAFQISPFYRMLADVSNIFVGLNFLLNTMIYLIFHEKFRTTLFLLATRCCRG